MKLRNARTLVLILAAAAAFLLPGRAAEAALVGVQIVVQLDSGSGFVVQGTAVGGAAGGSTPLVVNASAGNTLRLIVQYDQNPIVDPYNAYGFTLGPAGTPIDDPTEIDFVNGSATDLSGKGFAGLFGNPNNSLNDSTPTTGLANSAGTATSTSQDLFRLDYIVQAGVNSDALADFSVNLTGIGTGNTINTAKQEATIRVDGAGTPPPVPEPASMLLLGSGLAGLASYMRRNRK